MEDLLQEDVRNNSAWSHRYFVVFGHEELLVLEGEDGKGEMVRKELFELIQKGEGPLVADNEVVGREVEYTKGKIELAPMNLSAWNYLKGVLRRGARKLGSEREFCERFVRPEEGGEVDSEGTKRDGGGGELDFEGDGVRSSHAIDWLAEIYAEQGEKEKARKCLEALGRKWDPIRKNYWDYRIKLMGEGKYAGT